MSFTGNYSEPYSARYFAKQNPETFVREMMLCIISVHHV